MKDLPAEEEPNYKHRSQGETSPIQHNSSSRLSKKLEKHGREQLPDVPSGPCSFQERVVSEDKPLGTPRKDGWSRKMFSASA